MAQAEDRKEPSAGAGCLVLLFTLAWVVVLITALADWQDDYFTQEDDVLQFVIRLAVFLLVVGAWGAIGGRIVEGVARAYRDLHGERLRVSFFRSPSKVCMYLIPSGLIMDIRQKVDLRRGQHVPSSFTKAGRAMTAGILNVSNVDRVMFNPNLAVLFKENPTAQDMRMVDLAIADALWVHGGKPVTFVERPWDDSERPTTESRK